MCSPQASGGHRRGEGLVACAMTASRLGARCMGAMRPPLPPGRPADPPFSLDEALEVARRAALLWDAILAHLHARAQLQHLSQLPDSPTRLHPGCLGLFNCLEGNLPLFGRVTCPSLERLSA